MYARSLHIFWVCLLTINYSCSEDQLNEGQQGIGGSSNPNQMQGGGQILEPPMLADGCIGPRVEEGLGMLQAAENDIDCATCTDAAMPNFVLQDLSPTSCGYGRYYSLEAFIGQVTFVVLLRSTCGYCHAQLEKLEQLRFELMAAGYELNMVVINEVGTERTVDLLSDRSQIAILQDMPEVMAWEALSIVDENSPTGRIGGDKDDMYIYSAEGKLWQFLDDDDPAHSLNLSTEEGYLYLKTQLIEALSE